MHAIEWLRVGDLLGHVLVGLAQKCRDLEEKDAHDVLESEGTVIAARIDKTLVEVVVR